MKLIDLEIGAAFGNLHVLVEKKSEGVTKSGKPYLNLTVRDDSRSLNGKVWDYSREFHGDVLDGSVVCIDGAVDEYQGAPQLRINTITPSSESITKFAKSTRFDVSEMWSRLVDIVGTFKEPLTKFVAEEILLKHENFVDAFKKAPAAKTVHNAWYGGLLEHVISLCGIAEPVIQHYQSRYKMNLSRDKVLFGLIMHDAGKVIEYDYSKPSFGYTKIGKLTNHIVIGPAWVYETANRFPTKDANFKLERAHLMHLLAAHHGTEEWGSPVKPSSLEALLVHHLDNLDSKMMHALELVEAEAPGDIPGFSARSYFEKTSYLKV